MNEARFRERWPELCFIYLLSVLAAAQVGRFAPAASDVTQELTIDLATFGWAVSLVTLASAVLGLIAGFAVVAFGLKRSLVFGAAGAGLLTIFGAMAPDIAVLLVFRAIEGLFYLAVVVAAPTAIAAAASREKRTAALALWGTFFVVGLSLSSFVGGYVSELFGWRTWFGMCGASLVVASACAYFFIRPDEQGDHGVPQFKATVFRISKEFWILTGAFFSITLLSVSVLSILPSYLELNFGITRTMSGILAGGLALASLVGNVFYGVFSRLVSNRSFALLANALLLLAVYPAFGMQVDWIAGPLAGCALILFALGILAGQAFAMVPTFFSEMDLRGAANGCLTQIGSVGALVGPPLTLWVTTQTDWRSVAGLVAVAALVQILLLRKALGHIQSRATPVADG